MHYCDVIPTPGQAAVEDAELKLNICDKLTKLIIKALIWWLMMIGTVHSHTVTWTFKKK